MKRCIYATIAKTRSSNTSERVSDNMASLNSTIQIVNEVRPCVVKGKEAYFHQWGEIRELVDASAPLGGHGGRIISQTVGIIEYKEDGTVRECYPSEIRFTDGINEKPKYLFRSEI
jgi:hypothetical protein